MNYGPLETDLIPAYNAAIPDGEPARSWSLVEAALKAHPIDAISAANRPYLAIAELAALSSQPDQVRRFRTAWESTVPIAERDSNIVHVWDGMEALARSDWSPAAAAFGRAHTGQHCSPCAGYQWAYALDRGGQVDSAAAVYRGIVDSPYTDQFDTYDDATWYPTALEKIGEYYQVHGNRAKAISYLTRFTALWKNADPDLQPRVRDAKARIAQLQAEPVR